MEFFLELLLTAVISLLFSFLVAKLVSVATVENTGREGANDPSEIIGVGDQFETEEFLSGKKMDTRVMESERNLSVVDDDNVELVDLFGNGADRVDQVEEAATVNAEIRGDREELVVFTAEAESTAVVSPDNNVIVEDMIVRVEEEKSDSPEEIVLQGQEDRSESTEFGRSGCVENEESGGDVLVVESEEEVRVVETNTVAESDTEGDDEEKEELSIEDDDDWEGIERTELEIAFAAAANLLEESGKAEEIGAEAKMELYGLHKIASEGPCREPQPMAVMVSARAKWNAWQKLGNMSQEEAMEQYLALVSKEVPGLMNAGHTVGKMSEMETSVKLLPNSGSLEDPTNLDTTSVS